MNVFVILIDEVLNLQETVLGIYVSDPILVKTTTATMKKKPVKVTLTRQGIFVL